MSPTNELMELIYASKLLAKTIDEVDEKVAALGVKTDALQASIVSAREQIATVDKKLELLPLVIADKLESLIAKRTSEAFEDLRVTMDEMRNKLWAIKKQIKDQTGSHLLPTAEQLAMWEGKKKDKEEEEDKEGGVSIKRGKFRLDLPFSEGTWKVFKVIGIILISTAVTAATGGGIWVLVDRIRHALSGGG